MGKMLGALARMIQEEDEKSFLTDKYLKIDDLKDKFYCELVIDRNGNMVRLHGSHITALELILSSELGCSIEDVLDNTDPNRYFDYDDYLLEKTNAVMVRYDSQKVFKGLNPKQKRTFHELVINKKIISNLIKNQ